MKPISISFRCFGPYMAPQFIDFSDLERNGLFLICGETGSGKTTILDAMCIALYGKASGDNRGELSEMRCKLAAKEDATEVEFIFDNGGRRYKFVRRLTIKRKNETEEHQCMEWHNGQWMPFLANSKKTAVNAKAEEIIGLTYNQFRQVIILPQGQFEQLLTSKSEDKELILTKLFHAERWERAVKLIVDETNAENNDLNTRREEIQNRLKKYECNSLRELLQKLESSKEELQSVNAEMTTADEKLKQQRAIYQKALLDSREFSDLERRKKKYLSLVSKKSEMEDEEKRLSFADAAEKLHPIYESYLEKKKSFEKAKGDLKAAQIQLKKLTEHLKKVKNERETHEKGQAVYEEQKTRLVRLESAQELYDRLNEKRKQLDETEKQFKKKKATENKALCDLNNATEIWKQAIENQRRIRDEYSRCQQMYLSSIGGILAKELKPGVPCPVCGSCDHPNPATVADEHVTDAQLNQLSQEESKANQKEEETRKQRGKAESAKEKASQEKSDIEIKLTAAKSAYEEATAGMIEGISTSSALLGEIAIIKSKISDFDREEKRTSEFLKTAQENELLAKEKAKTAQEAEIKCSMEYADAKTAWEQRLLASVFSDEEQFVSACIEADEKRRRRDKCTEYRTALKNAETDVQEKQNELEAKTPPDMEAEEKKVNVAEESATYWRTQKTKIETVVEEMRSEAKALKEMNETYEADKSRVEQNLRFARWLNGSDGISLQRYVLGVRFSAVTAAANHLLENVYGGRYRLYRTDEGTGKIHKRGLELEVFDVTQNQRRSVNSLSGGEKFLVSLSLAIGLSTVIRASGGGVHMEAMFVDEGFGSLDSKAVDDAVDILQNIRQRAGTVVGVISHVNRLQETIGTKLYIEKSKHGSMIHLRG